MRQQLPLHRLPACRASASSNSSSRGSLVHTRPSQRAKLAVFVSGGGSNFKAIHAATQDGRIAADVAVVVSDKLGCGGWQYAEGQGIPCQVFPARQRDPPQGVLSTEGLLEALTARHAVDYVLLAGYMRGCAFGAEQLVPVEVVRAYARAMLNIHPGLLPSFGGKGFYGTRVHEAVIASGARFSGPTVHFVDENYDTGPILAQATVSVHPHDTPAQLAARVLREEHKLYPRAVAALVDGRISWREDGVPIMWEAQ